jgi:hypothetical protein
MTSKHLVNKEHPLCVPAKEPLEFLMSNIYQEQGYANRRAYLESLAEDHGVELSVVMTLADTLGPSEDFDGLIVHVEDAAC